MLREKKQWRGTERENAFFFFLSFAFLFSLEPQLTGCYVFTLDESGLPSSYRFNHLNT